MSRDPKAAESAMRARLTALLGREAQIASHLRGEDGRREADFSDAAIIVADDEVLEGLDEAARAEVEAIRGAFDRLTAGTWGICEGCGQEIPSQRLAVLPHVRLCIACAVRAGG